MGIHSFDYVKTITTGEGGAVVTNDEELYEMLVLMRNHGSKPKYFHKYVGGNFRLDPIQAAALLVKLGHLDSWSAARRQHAEYYNQKFADSDIVTPYIHPDCVSVYNQYVIRVPQRNELFDHLQANHVGCAIYYPLSLHMQECFATLKYREGDFPESEQAAQEVLALPVYPELTEAMQDYVAETVLSFYG